MKRRGLFLAGLLAVFLPAAPAISQTYGGDGGPITAPGGSITGQPSSPGTSGDPGDTGRGPLATESEEGRRSETEGRESGEEELARRGETGERQEEREMTPGSPDAATPGSGGAQTSGRLGNAISGEGRSR